MHCRRAVDEVALVMRPKRANVYWPMVFDGGFRVREADAETDGKCHRGQARRARQEPVALRFEREIRVFPALAQTSTKNHCGHNAEASVRRVCGWNEVEDTVSPCPPSEDLKTWSRAERLSSLERKKRAVLNSSAKPIPCRRKAFMTD